MKAFIWEKYGAPETLRMAEVEEPAPDADEVLVKVLATSVNAADWHSMRGKPLFSRATLGLLRPKHKILGVDIAGQVKAVGSAVPQFKPGDEVYANLLYRGYGGFAEYVSVPVDVMSSKPANLSFEEAAAVPMAALTALQGLRHLGGIQPEQKVLINGASGGVGTFAVQIAKSYGPEVTGVTSTRNVDLVRSLGADHIVDYTTTDFVRSGRRYDLIYDILEPSVKGRKRGTPAPSAARGTSRIARLASDVDALRWQYAKAVRRRHAASSRLQQATLWAEEHEAGTRRIDGLAAKERAKERVAQAREDVSAAEAVMRGAELEERRVRREYMEARSRLEEDQSPADLAIHAIKSPR
jgi:hypothetical protein